MSTVQNKDGWRAGESAKKTILILNVSVSSRYHITTFTAIQAAFIRYVRARCFRWYNQFASWLTWMIANKLCWKSANLLSTVVFKKTNHIEWINIPRSMFVPSLVVPWLHTVYACSLLKQGTAMLDSVTYLTSTWSRELGGGVFFFLWTFAQWRSHSQNAQSSHWQSEQALFWSTTKDWNINLYSITYFMERGNVVEACKFIYGISLSTAVSNLLEFDTMTAKGHS